MYMKVLLIISCLVATVLTDCRDVKVKQNFNLEQYSKMWYQQAQYNQPANIGYNKCVTSTYNHNADNHNYDVIIKQRVRFINTKLISVGTLGFADPSKEEGTLTLSIELPFGGTIDSPQQVLGTDYEQWAVVYSCKAVLGNTKGYITEGAYILTRKPFYTAVAMATINEEIDKVLLANGLPREDFHMTSHKDC